MLKVLLVEDQKATQALIEDLLDEITGYEIAACATTETQATERLHEHGLHWDVAILDLVLHEGSGFNLLTRIRREHPDRRVVVFSEYASPAVRERCVALGADAAIGKAEFAELRRWLERFRDDAAQGRPMLQA